MERHTTSGRWRLGLALALVPATLWGVLPIALKILLQQLDGFTVAWARFVGATVVLTIILGSRGRMPKLRQIERGDRWLLLVCILGLTGNYALIMLGLQWISPTTVATTIQISPLFLGAGAMLVFRERFTKGQWVGAVVLVSGLALFFRDQLGQVWSDVVRHEQGVMLVLLSAVSWVFYALAQKQLLRRLPSQSIMVMVYCGAALCLFPFAHPGSLLWLDRLHLILLVLCAANTLFAYGALSEAFQHAPASRVSAVLTIQPLLTIAATAVVARLWPGLLTPDRLTTAGLLGAVLVVAGASATALYSAGGASGQVCAEEPLALVASAAEGGQDT